jgi:hypothetical protein
MKGLLKGNKALCCAAFVATTLVLLAASMSAQSSCQSGQSTIQNPGNNNTLPSDYTVVAATTGSSCEITAMRLYVDSVHTAHGSLPGGFSCTYTFSAAYHNLAAVSWNDEGYAFTSPVTLIFVAPKEKTVYITSPAASQTVNSTVMRAYVDSLHVYDADYPLNAAISFKKIFIVGKALSCGHSLGQCRRLHRGLRMRYGQMRIRRQMRWAASSWST